MTSESSAEIQKIGKFFRWYLVCVTAAPEGSWLYCQCGSFAILKPKNRKTCTFSAHTYPPPVDPSPDQPPTDPPWSVGPSPTQVDATNFVAIDTLQEPPPALPIRASQLACRRHPRKPRPILLFRPPIGPAPRVRGGCLFACALSYQGVGLPQCTHR